MIYDSSTSHNPEEEEDFQYQGKRPDQVDYSENVVTVLVTALAFFIIFIVWAAFQ